jgi:two-component system cell cycle response regulator
MSDTLPECRVLIAEADPIERADMEKLLTGWGYTVESIEDGPAALERLTAPEPPGIALLDYDLPKMNCIEICQSIRRAQTASAASAPGLEKPSVEKSSMIQSVPSQLLKCGRLDLSIQILALLTPGKSQEDGADSDSTKVASALAAGVSDILLKPARDWELKLRLQSAQQVIRYKNELKRLSEDVAIQASHDPLTGLWNRETALSLLFQETQRAQRGRSPLSIILVDLDHFAERNLEFGYEACDAVMQQLAVRLRRSLRSYDVLGRSGEDEFLLILPGCSLNDAIAMAERLRSLAMHFPFCVKHSCFTVRASFGVAESRGRLPLLVLREAERALAAAKVAGRDRVRSFTPELLQAGVLSGFSALQAAEKRAEAASEAQKIV